MENDISCYYSILKIMTITNNWYFFSLLDFFSATDLWEYATSVTHTSI